MTTEIAIIRGPYFRPNSTLLWEYLHNEYNEIEVTGFGSDPEWFDTSELEMPIENLHWWDGKPALFGHENVVYKLLDRYKLPNIALSGIRQVVEDHDAVHITENYRLYSFYTALYCSRMDTPLFVDSHENIPHRPANPITWGIKKTVNSLADGFTSPTAASKRALIHEGVAPESVQLLPNVVNFDRFDSGPKDPKQTPLPGKLESTFNILFVHGLNERKGTHYLLDAFTKLRQHHNDTSLILLGENELNPAYYKERVTEKSDIYHVEYIPEIQDLYNLADIFVLPSIAVERWKEQFGRAIIEAMACGLPSVVTDVGGPPLVVAEGETSLVVEPRSADSLASAVCRLYEEDDLRTNLAEGAYEYVRQNYAPSVVGEDLHAFYRTRLDE